MANSFLKSVAKGIGFAMGGPGHGNGDHGDGDEEDKKKSHSKYIDKDIQFYDSSDYTTAPDSVEAGLETIFSQNFDPAHIMVPPLESVGIPQNAAKGINNSKTCISQTESDIYNGFLDKITVIFDPKKQVYGIQQYFGGNPGAFIGIHGDFVEKTFHIPLGDYVVCCYQLYSDDDYLRAIRFVTMGGRDSGWLGKMDPGDGAYYEARSQMVLTSTERTMDCPPFAFDAWLNDDLQIRLIGCRTSRPFTLSMGISSAMTPTDLGSSPQWSRTWSLTNNTSIEQEIIMYDKVTTNESHTLTTSLTTADTISNTKTVSLSAVMGVLTVGGELSFNETSSITQSSQDAITVTTTTSQTVRHPVAVAPNTQLDGTLTVYEDNVEAAIDLNILWLGVDSGEDIPGSTTIYYVGVTSDKIVLDLNESAIT